MAKRIWSSPRFFVALRGDRDAAGRLERKARIYAGYLFDQLTDGQTSRTETWTRADQYRITVTVWQDVLGERARAEIYVPEKGDEDKIFLESGCLYWDPLTPFLPLRVNLGTQLKKFPYPRPYIDDQYFESHYWTATRPDIEYPDYLNTFYVDRNYQPTWWSGLARLAMQGLHAIKRIPNELFGSLSALSQGIVKDTSGNYWRVRLDSDGVFSAKLHLSEAYAPLRCKEALTRLSAGKYVNKYERNMLEARVLAGMEAGEETQIGTAEQIGVVFAEGGPLAYGWKFARGKLEAAMVTFREECMPEFVDITCIGQFVTSLFIVKFTREKVGRAYELTGITVEHAYGPERSRPRSAVNSIYVPIYSWDYDFNYQGKVPGWGENPFPLCCYIQFEGNVQPHYCWYSETDELEVVWYVQYADAYDSINTAIESGCGVGHFTRNGQVGVVPSEDNGYREGGWLVREWKDGAPDHHELRDGYYAYSDQIHTIDIVDNGTTALASGIPVYSDTPYLSVIQFFCDNEFLYNYYYERNPWTQPRTETIFSWDATIHLGELHQYRWVKYHTATPRLWTLVIAANDAEAVYILARPKAEATATYEGSLTATSWGSGPDDFRGYGTGNITFNFNIDGVRTETIDWEGAFYIRMEPGIWSGVFPTPNCEMIEIGSSETVTPASYKVHTPHGELEMREYGGHWSTFFRESILDSFFIDGQPIGAGLSYSGDGWVSAGEGYPKVIGGYNNTAGIASMFIGGA